MGRLISPRNWTRPLFGLGIVRVAKEATVGNISGNSHGHSNTQPNNSNKAPSPRRRKCSDHDHDDHREDEDCEEMLTMQCKRWGSDGSTTSTTAVQAPQGRHVRFSSHASIRVYPQVLGEHPYCSEGCPLELGWEYAREESVELQEDTDTVHDHHHPHGHDHCHSSGGNQDSNEESQAKQSQSQSLAHGSGQWCYKLTAQERLAILQAQPQSYDEVEIRKACRRRQSCDRMNCRQQKRLQREFFGSSRDATVVTTTEVVTEITATIES